MAEFTRFAETITVKEDMRVVSITVKPIVSDCTGRIWFTDLMVQEGDRLTGFVINPETLLKKYREDDVIVALRFYNCIIRSSGTVVIFNLGSTTTGLDIQVEPIQDMAAGSIVLSQGAGSHKATFLRKLPPVIPFRFWPLPESVCETELPPKRMVSSSIPLPVTANTQLHWRKENPQSSILNFRKCRTEVMCCEGLFTGQAMYGVVLYGQHPNVSGAA